MTSQPEKFESGIPPEHEQRTAPVSEWWKSQPVLPQRKPTSSLATARLVWALLVGVVMVAVWLAGQDSDSAVRNASSTADMNNISASGAPQQSVVNGWHQVDLMEIQIRQTGQLATLVLLAGLGLVGDAAMRAAADRRAN